MAVNMKLGVDLTGFKQGISEANAQLKTFDAQIKLAESSFKKTGDAEAAMYQKTDALTNKLKVQKQMVQQYWQTLEKMRLSGVDPMSKSYQQMEASMLNMQAAANETEMALNGLSASQLNAATSADKLTQSVGNIGKKMSLDQVISGIDKITGGLENAAKKAVDLGEKLWNTVMDSARRADDSATMAEMYGIDLDTFLRMQKLVAGGIDTSVDAILTAQTKLNKGIGSGSTQVMDYMRELGLIYESGKGATTFITDDKIDMFWRAGQAIMAMGEAYDQEAAAQALFGRGWKELVPLFNTYKSLDEYNAALAEQTVNDEKTIRDLAALNDAVGKLESSWTTLKDEMLEAVAPALTKGADAISNLLDKLTEYLKTDEGQQLLENMGKAVEGLFSDLSKIDPAQVVEGFTAVFEKIIGGVQWLYEHKGEIVEALRHIVEGWGMLKLTGGALEIMKLIEGVKSFQGVPIETPSSVTSSNGDIIATGGGSGAGTGGNWLTKALNNLTLINLAGAMYEGTEGQLRKMRDEFEKQTADMTPEERNKYIMMTEFHMSEEQYNQMYGEINGENGVPVEVKPEVPEDAAANIAEQVGKVTIPINFDIPGIHYFGSGGGGNNVAMEKANGIWSVPYDGYLSLLHKNERVMPAREVSSRNFSSNLYVESMIMNNGADAAGLAASMAAAQRRTMTGFGS